LGGTRREKEKSTTKYRKSGQIWEPDPVWGQNVDVGSRPKEKVPETAWSKKKDKDRFYDGKRTRTHARKGLHRPDERSKRSTRPNGGKGTISPHDVCVYLWSESQVKTKGGKTAGKTARGQVNKKNGGGGYKCQETLKAPSDRELGTRVQKKGNGERTGRTKNRIKREPAMVSGTQTDRVLKTAGGGEE